MTQQEIQDRASAFIASIVAGRITFLRVEQIVKSWVASYITREDAEQLIEIVNRGV